MWWVTPEVPSPGTPGASPEQGPCFQVCGHLHRAQELAEEGRAGAHLGRKITGAFSKQSPFRWLTEPGAVLLLDKMQGSLPKPALRCANSPPEAVPRALQLPRGGGGGGGGSQCQHNTQRESGGSALRAGDARFPKMPKEDAKVRSKLFQRETRRASSPGQPSPKPSGIGGCRSAVCRAAPGEASGPRKSPECRPCGGLSAQRLWVGRDPKFTVRSHGPSS